MAAPTVARLPRVAFVLVAILLAGTLGVAPASGASPAAPASTLAPIGHKTPTALGPGVPATDRPAFAQPFHALDPGALRAAKLHAAAIASRGSRQFGSYGEMNPTRAIRSSEESSTRSS